MNERAQPWVLTGLLDYWLEQLLEQKLPGVVVVGVKEVVEHEVVWLVVEDRMVVVVPHAVPELVALRVRLHSIEAMIDRPLGYQLIDRT